ncbi:MAG: hypothetical protein NC925_02720 [Candidatus Omnitrophica bacterium]|nr:hypothetical protein [Candidatus Omnitrophota bacterium]MCM8831394.1 hypothetical protein [Candidatus Omnitrophota bacterium]
MANKIAKLSSNIKEKIFKKIEEPCVLTDNAQKISYPLNEILNKIIVGDCLMVIKKLLA